MKRIGLKNNLQTRITILIASLILVSLGISILLIGSWAVKNTQKEIEVNIKNVSKVLSSSYEIQKSLYYGDEKRVQEITRKALDNLEGIDIITIADMDGVRYGHPNPERVGQMFVGGDEKKVLENGLSYTSQAVGTLGRSIRYFEPIYYNGEQTGFVMVGVLYDGVVDLKNHALFVIFIFSVLGITLGVVGALIIARKIRKSLLGLEPEEIVYLYRENKAMLDSIDEGIIAVDSVGAITLVNDYARKIINVGKENVVGKPVLEVFPTSKLLDILDTGKSEYNQEQEINETVILTNRVPIKDGDNIIGAMAFFDNRTKVKELAEEITGVRQVIYALRANTHEFMNKLHLISGLIELNEIDEVKKYIKLVSKEQEQIRFFLMKNIKNSTISAILLGKYSRAKELDINMIIDENSCLEKYYRRIQNESLVTIIGNLLDNGMNAIAKKDVVGEIYFRIEDIDDFIEIEVVDNGIGIKEEHRDKIFERGFSTREKDGGIGLFLVKKVLEQLNGEVYVDSIYNEGTSIVVRLPKGDEE